MKLYRKTIFKIILLLAVFFCYGLNSYSNRNSLSDNIEHSTQTNSDNNSIKYIDFFDDEYVLEKHYYSSIMEIKCLSSFIHTTHFIQFFFISIWQPPKVN